MGDATLATPAIRILLADIPGLVADLVKRAVATQPDMQIVGELRHHDDLTREVSHRGADLVVTALTPSGVPPACREQLFAASGVPIIAIGGPEPLEVFHRRRVREVGLECLLSEIRCAAQHRHELPN